MTFPHRMPQTTMRSLHRVRVPHYQFSLFENATLNTGKIGNDKKTTTKLMSKKIIIYYAYQEIMSFFFCFSLSFVNTPHEIGWGRHTNVICHLFAPKLVA